MQQLVTPNVNVRASRGYCLKYVDDAVNAPSRMPTAQMSFNREKANGNVRGGDPPVGVWTPIYFSLNRGIYAGLGHVAWAYNHGNWVEIHDSEVHSGARGIYRSMAEILAWFGAFGMQYLGWSYYVDGVRVIKDEPAPAPASKTSGSKVGTATVLVQNLNVRSAPSTSATIVATYSKGQSFKYDSWCVANGYVWVSYVGASGLRRYLAVGPNDGNRNNTYVSGF